MSYICEARKGLHINCYRVVQAPVWGYDTETSYYRDVQSSDAVLGIKIPFLGINATDDPVSPDPAIYKMISLTAIDFGQ